jgi:UDP-GlcNAc:undecaprenyl-phosphate GlcNAc-1-phosphate transferase
MIELILFTVVPMLLLTSLLRPLALKFALVDYPCSRKRHEGPTPTIGGVLVFGMVCWTTTLFPEYQMAPLPLLVAGAALLFLGLYDDVYTAGPRARLTLQIAFCALFLFVSGKHYDLIIQIAPNLSLNLSPGFLEPLFSLVFIIAIINAFNFIDGIDGAAASMVMVALVGLLAFQSITGVNILEWFIKALLLITFVFCLKNTGLTKRGRIFLGDSGSTLLGFFVAAVLLYNFQVEAGSYKFGWVEAMFCVLLPILDALVVIVRRIVKGRSAFTADRSHLHHLLILAGFSVRATWCIIVLIALLFLGSGLLIKTIAPWASIYMLLALSLTYFWVFFRASQFVKWSRSIRLFFRS